MTAAVSEPVLEVRDLAVRVRDVDLVRDLDLTIGRGERVGLIGESGSGKSLTALAVMGLLPEGLSATGSVRLAGSDRDLLGADERTLSRVRGRDVAMVFQEPMTALNPSMRVGEQVAEAMLVHGTWSDRRGARAAAVDLLDQVRLPEPAAIARAYPHQLSGGQRQRVVLAIALANDPALLFITHDLAVVASVCQRVLVLYGGRVVEAGPVGEVFTRPRHRYTQGLLAASDLERLDERGRLATIPGSVPPAGAFPDGCVFRTRCPYATDVCAQVPPWTGPDEALGYACHHPAGSGGEGALS